MLPGGKARNSTQSKLLLLLSLENLDQITAVHPLSCKFDWVFCINVKVKVIQQQAWTDPRGSGSVKAKDFLDVRHYKGGRSSAVRTGRLYPRINPWHSFSETESTTGQIFPSEPRKKSQRHHRESIPRPPTSSAVP